MHRRRNVLHRVINRKSGRHASTWRVNVQLDRLGRVLCLEEQELSSEQGRWVIGDLVTFSVGVRIQDTTAYGTEKDHAFFQKPRVNVVASLPSSLQHLTQLNNDQAMHRVLDPQSAQQP